MILSFSVWSGGNVWNYKIQANVSGTKRTGSWWRAHVLICSTSVTMHLIFYNFVYSIPCSLSSQTAGNTCMIFKILIKFTTGKEMGLWMLTFMWEGQEQVSQGRPEYLWMLTHLASPEDIHTPACHSCEEARAKVSSRVDWITAVQTHGHSNGHDDETNA